MVLGHYGLALAAKRIAPRTSLGTLVLAAQLADEIWPILLLLGIEQVSIQAARQPTLHLAFVHYPFTHSLLTAAIAGVVFGLVYFALRRDSMGAVVVALLVPSHWVLDFLVHVPDLPLWPGGPKFGLGMWHSVPATLALEFALFIAGTVIYLRSTRAKDKIGVWGLWTFLALLTLGYLGSLLGPPPKDVQSLAYSAVILWIFVPWSYWIDAHRSKRIAE